MSGRKRRGSAPNAPRSVPDVLAPDLRVVFCGINPGFVSAEAGAHFANPRNDFWRLLHDAGFTPRLYAPDEQFSVLELGIGLTNAAHKTTRGSSDLRRADFAGSHERLLELALEYHPRAIAFVGKEAFRGAFGRRVEHGPQEETLDDVGTYVLPSTSPANAAVRYAERLKWFSALNEWLEPVDRPAVRALVVDDAGRALLVQFRDVTGQTWWANPGGGIEEGEDVGVALRRELAEEIGLTEFELGPEVWRREHTFGWAGRIIRQRERVWLVRVPKHEPKPSIDLTEENVAEIRWWTLDQLEATSEELAPRRLPELLRDLEENGPPREPFDAGV